MVDLLGGQGVGILLLSSSSSLFFPLRRVLGLPVNEVVHAAGAVVLDMLFFSSASTWLVDPEFLRRGLVGACQPIVSLLLALPDFPIFSSTPLDLTSSSYATVDTAP